MGNLLRTKHGIEREFVSMGSRNVHVAYHCSNCKKYSGTSFFSKREFRNKHRNCIHDEEKPVKIFLFGKTESEFFHDVVRALKISKKIIVEKYPNTISDNELIKKYERRGKEDLQRTRSR